MIETKHAKQSPHTLGELLPTQLVGRFLQHPAVSGSVWLFSGAIIAGIINYLFNVILARDTFLGTVDYGTLAALTSMLYLASLVGQTIATVAANYSASFISEGKKEFVGRLIRALKRRVWRYGFPTLILFAGLSRLVARFLNIDSPLPVLMLAPLILLMLLSQVVGGTLQGILAFGYLALVSVGGSLLRLVLAVFIVLAGYRVSGVLLSNIIASYLTYKLSHIPLRPYVLHALPAEPLPKREIITYTGPVFIALVGINSFFAMDVILAKHFLSAHEAGIYSGIALLARIVYFASAPFISVMFPVVSQSVSQKVSPRATAILTLGAIFCIAVAVSSVFFLFSDDVISRTVGSSYIVRRYTLGFMAVTLSLISVAAWLIHFLLAHRDSRAAWILPLCAIMQIVLIARFHGTLEDIVYSSLAASILLTISLLVYILFWTRNRNSIGQEERLLRESTPIMAG